MFDFVPKALCIALANYGSLSYSDTCMPNNMVLWTPQTTLISVQGNGITDTGSTYSGRIVHIQVSFNDKTVSWVGLLYNSYYPQASSMLNGSGVVHYYIAFG